MKIVFFTFPYAGHAVPNMALFQELLKRKVKLIIFGSEIYLKKYLIGDNVVFEPYPQYITDACKINTDSSLTPEEAAVAYYSYYYDEDRSRRREYLMADLTNHFYIDYYEKLKEFNPDSIMYDYNAFFTKKIMSKLKVKCMELNCNTCEPKNLIKSKSWENFISNIVINQVKESPSLDEIITMNRKIHRLYKKILYQYEIDDIEKSYFAYHCPELQDEAELVNTSNIYLGFNLPKASNCEKDGSIYVSRGTMSDTFGVQTLLKTLQSLENIDAKIIASLGNNKAAQAIINEETCPNNIKVMLYTKQLECLAHASIFVTHGGITGVRESLINMTPMVVIPVNFNDYQVGKALEKVHAGILIEKHPLDKNEIEEKVNYMMAHIDEYRDGVNYIAEKLRSSWNKFGVNYLLKEIY